MFLIKLGTVSPTGATLILVVMGGGGGGGGGGFLFKLWNFHRYWLVLSIFHP